MAKRFFAHQVVGNRPDPLTEISTGLEIEDVAVGKNKSFVGDFVDQVRDREFHRDERTKAGAVKVQQLFVSAEITSLDAGDELSFCFVV